MFYQTFDRLVLSGWTAGIKINVNLYDLLKTWDLQYNSIKVYSEFIQ